MLPRSVITGRRVRNARLIACGVLLLLPALGAYATKRVFEARGISPLHFVSEEQLMHQYLLASQEGMRRQELIEIERRHGAGSLATESEIEFIRLVMAGTAGRPFMSSNEPSDHEVRLASTMLLAPGFPPEIRRDLVEEWLVVQATGQQSRWSAVWGEVIIQAQGLGLLTADQFDRFVHNGLEVEVFIDEKESIRPGQRAWVALRWNVRLGDPYWGSMRGIAGVVSIPGLDEWCNAPQVRLFGNIPERIGRITVPAMPGEYDLHGTVGVALSGRLRGLEKRIPTEKPDLTTVPGLDWAVPISCSFTVVEPEAAPDGAQP